MNSLIIAALLVGCFSSELVKEPVKTPDPMAERRAKVAHSKIE